MTSQDIQDVLRNMLVEEFKVDPAVIEPDATFKQMKLDSLDLVSLAMSLEDKLSVEIPDKELMGIETYGQAVELLEHKVGAMA